MLGLLRALVPYLRHHWAPSLLIPLVQIPSIAFITLEPLLLRQLIDTAIPQGDRQFMIWIVIGMLGLVGVNALGELGYYFVVARLGAVIMNDIRLRIFTHLQWLSASFFGRASGGDLLSRFTSDLETVNRVLTDELPLVIYLVLTVVGGGIVLLTIEPRLGVLILLLLPVISVAQWLLSAPADRASYHRQEDVSRVTQAVHEHLGAQRLVKAFDLHRLMLDRFGAELGRLRASTIRAGVLSGLLAAALAASSYLILVVSIIVAAFMAIHQQMTIGSLVAFSEIVWFVVSSVAELSRTVRPLQQGAAGMRRIRELLTEPPDVLDKDGALPLPRLAHAIRFEHVSFSYTGEEGQLDDLNVTIPAGSAVAVVGRSGSGKSTMLSLLMRFYDPTSGSITFDGHDLRDVTQASLRSQIGVVLQDTLLFNTTIDENIRLGNPTATEADIEAAARAAEIHDFILTLPEGYESTVGENGGNLSGGERQRIALARAILRDPRVLLLDEATASLDAETEAAINATLKRLARGRTVVFVTHRLTSAADADWIIVLDGGKLAEQGTHEQLLARGGVYRRAWSQHHNRDLDGAERQVAIEPNRLRATYQGSGARAGADVLED